MLIKVACFLSFTKSHDQPDIIETETKKHTDDVTFLSSFMKNDQIVQTFGTF